MTSIRIPGPVAALGVLLLGACSVLPLSEARAPGADPRIGAPEAGPPVQRDLKYVVVDVDRNELRVMDGERVLWSAPVGTGTGFRLTTGDRRWEFTTPSGTMHVQFKELEPVWILPDWYFIENRRPVPARDAAERRVPGGLGAAAIYLGNEIAIHGTDRPELLGRQVSHGCIRLSNRDVIRLFHNVQVGTPVVIVGEQEVLGEQPDSVAAFTRSAPRVARTPNPLERVATATLLTRLDRELAATSDTASAWVMTAHTLLERGLRDDAPALRGLLQRAARPTGEGRREEFATFLADAYARGSLRVVVSLNRIPAEARERAAGEIVRATMELWHGELHERLTPWPTRRVPPDRLGPEGRAGWDALASAEEGYRERLGVGASRGTARAR
jgi:hypothetical protein